MDKSERTTLCVTALRAFAEVYPGLTSDRDGQKRIVPYRFGTLLNLSESSRRVHPYQWFGGAQLPGSTNALKLLLMALSLVKERDEEIERLKKELEELRSAH